MSFLVPLILTAAVGTGVSKLVSLATQSKKQAPVQSPQVQPTRNAAADAIAGSDRLNKRRGAAANAVLGARGAESSAGGKQSLGL